MPGLDQPVHWIFLVILAGLLFGGYKKLPEMARSAGRSMRVFKTELKGLEDDDQARANASQAGVFTAPVAPAPAVVPLQSTAPPQAAVPLPAPGASAAAPVVPAPFPVQPQTASSYVPVEPASDPTAPPRA